MGIRRLPHQRIARLVIGGAVLLAATMGVPAARAQDEKDRQIRELRGLVERLGQRLNQLEQEVGVKKEAVAAAPAGAASPAPAEAPQSIGDRIKSLEEALKSVPLLSTMKDWQFGGHVAVSYNYNINDANAQNNFARVFDERANQFDINQAELYVEKPTSEASPIGFGIDFVVGRDAKKIHSAGLGESNQPFDLTQAYVTYKAPIGKGLDLKAGKFVTMHGAEVIRRTGNYQISRSLLFGFAIPFTHTGVSATYPVTDWLSLTLGVVNGWDNTDDENRDKSFHGAATLTPMKDLTLTVGGTYGSERSGADKVRRGLLDVVATYKPIPPLTLTLNYDYADEAGAATADKWQGIAGYATYDITDKWSVGFRGEYFIDQRGFRLGFTDPVTANPARLDLWELTLTTRYKLLDHLFASVEFRHDEARRDRQVFDDGGDAKRSSQKTIAAELVYQF